VAGRLESRFSMPCAQNAQTIPLTVALADSAAAAAVINPLAVLNTTAAQRIFSGLVSILEKLNIF